MESAGYWSQDEVSKARLDSAKKDFSEEFINLKQILSNDELLFFGDFEVRPEDKKLLLAYSELLFKDRKD